MTLQVKMCVARGGVLVVCIRSILILEYIRGFLLRACVLLKFVLCVGSCPDTRCTVWLLEHHILQQTVGNVDRPRLDLSPVPVTSPGDSVVRERGGEVSTQHAGVQAPVTSSGDVIKQRYHFGFVHVTHLR